MAVKTLVKAAMGSDLQSQTDALQSAADPISSTQQQQQPATAAVSQQRGKGIGGKNVPNAVVYWGILVGLASIAALVFPLTVTASYIVSCSLLSIWRECKGDAASFQTLKPPGWSRRRVRSVAVSVVNCLIADVLLTRYVREVHPPLLWQFESSPGILDLAWVYVSPLVLLFTHDTWFYICHRAMHSTKIGYRWIHAMHHANDAPEAWDLFYMHPVEMVVAVVIPFLITPRLFSLHWVIWEGLVLKGILIDCYGHCGFESMPFHPFKLTQFSLWPGFPWRSIFLTAKHHDDHHRYRVGNYSLYLCLWDIVLGTAVDVAPPNKTT